MTAMLVLWLGSVGCGGSDDGGDGETDADSDSDTDVDSGSDADTDVDTDSDSSTGSLSETDTGEDPRPYCEHSCGEPASQSDCPELDVDACEATCIAEGSVDVALDLDACMHDPSMVDCATAQACVDALGG